MEDFLSQISVVEYPAFRKMVKEKTHWTRTQYNDRRAGRVKLSLLERDVLQQVVREIKTRHETV